MPNDEYQSLKTNGAAGARPVLRLVGTEAPGRDAGRARPVTPGSSAIGRPQVRHVGRVASEVQSAARSSEASIGMTDPRWVLAARVAANLQGGKAAVLRPEVRERLVGGAVKMGLRPFDANLVIAVVQDAARTGQGPLGPLTSERLELIRGAEKPSDAGSGVWFRLVAALTFAFVLVLLVINWIG